MAVTVCETPLSTTSSLEDQKQQQATSRQVCLKLLCEAATLPGLEDHENLWGKIVQALFRCLGGSYQADILEGVKTALTSALQSGKIPRCALSRPCPCCFCASLPLTLTPSLSLSLSKSLSHPSLSLCLSLSLSLSPSLSVMFVAT